MSLQHLGKGTLRVVKNYTKGYSDVQAKVRDATSNDPWGPSGTQMNELAQMTFNQNEFVEIMEMLDKRLNDKGKNWRHVFKALTVLDYCLHAGSENVVIYFRDNVYIVKTLKEFQFIDEYGKDQGANVRQKAKDITNLLQDESRLREERLSRAHMRDRMIGAPQGEPDGFGDDDNVIRRSRSVPPGGRPRGRGDDDAELKRAIEASKRSLQEEQARTAEENDLQKALRLSEEEEAKRKQALEDANARSLFDDAQQTAPSATNPFPLIDTTGNPSSLQPQFTQLQPQFTQIQPQFTSFNPYAQLQQQEAMQAEYLQNQQQWQQQQQQAQAQAQAQAQQDEWMRQQQFQQFQQQQQQQQRQQQQQQLAPQPTGFGSNNPFAPSSFSHVPPVPSLPQSTFPPSSNGPPASFSTPNLVAPTSSSPISQRPQQQRPQQQQPTRRNDGEHAHLANLLANRDDGLDTFGNQGLLRYGHTAAGLQAQKTGHNPFQQQQQQTATSGDQPFFSI